jgi:hypothetical protein
MRGLPPNLPLFLAATAFAFEVFSPRQTGQKQISGTSCIGHFMVGVFVFMAPSVKRLGVYHGPVLPSVSRTTDRNALAQNAKADLKPARGPDLIAWRHILNPAVPFNQPCQGIVQFASRDYHVSSIAARARRVRGPSARNRVNKVCESLLCLCVRDRLRVR